MLITHELNENPFFAAFMDWKAQIRLFRVTVTGTTVVELTCSFRTTAHVRAPPCPLFASVSDGLEFSFSGLARLRWSCSYETTWPARSA